MRLSLILPARNEASSLEHLLPVLRDQYPDAEIIVVDDGSQDTTAEIASRNGVRLLSHPYGMGNGAAIKSGVRAASGDVLLLMDADGQHQPEDVPALLEKLEAGYDMVVGARQAGSQAGLLRALANRFYNHLASYMTGHRIEDLTSGFRAVRAEKFRKFLYLLPNGFSYPTTSTMAFFRSGYPVAYVPIHSPRRKGKSHLHPLKDGMRFLLIIFRIGALYSPLKLFVPISLFFLLSGLGNYIYTYISENRFTNMSALLLSISVIVFLIGMVSEQITALQYRDGEKD